jgi:hypothetical protein
VDPVLLDAFGLDPDVLHLNHGAFGVAPTIVRQAAVAGRSPQIADAASAVAVLVDAREQRHDDCHGTNKTAPAHSPSPLTPIMYIM